MKETNPENRGDLEAFSLVPYVHHVWNTWLSAFGWLAKQTRLCAFLGSQLAVRRPVVLPKVYSLPEFLDLSHFLGLDRFEGKKSVGTFVGENEMLTCTKLNMRPATCIRDAKQDQTSE